MTARIMVFIGVLLCAVGVVILWPLLWYSLEHPQMTPTQVFLATGNRQLLAALFYAPGIIMVLTGFSMNNDDSE